MEHVVSYICMYMNAITNGVLLAVILTTWFLQHNF